MGSQEEGVAGGTPQGGTAQGGTVSSGMGSILTDAGYYMIGSMASRAIGFIFIPFYARYLSPAQYGLVELMELSTQTVAMVFGLGAIGLALTRMFYDQRTARDRDAVVATAVIANAALSLVVTALACAAARPMSELVFHTAEWASLLRAAFVAMFFSNLMEVVLVYERILNRARFFLVFTTLSLLASVALNILFIGVLGAGVWGFVVTKLTVCIAGSIYLLARLRGEVGWYWRAAFVPEFARLGVPLVISGVAFFIFHFSDRFFLTGWVSLADLGRYSLAYKLAMLVSVLTGDAFSKVWEATLFRHTDQAGWRQRFASVAAYYMVALLATGLGVALFSPALLRVIVPPDYQPPPLVIPLVVLSYVAREIGDFFRNMLMINKRTRALSRISVGGTVLNVAANWLLISQFGVVGAALATLLTWTAYMVVCWAVANGEHRLPMRPLAYLWVTALGGLFYAGAIDVALGNIVVQFLFDGVVVLCFLAAAAFAFLSRAERADVWAAARRLAAWALARLGGGVRPPA